MCNASREAFDLHTPACRHNFKCRFKKNKWKLRWWKLVITDTWNNVMKSKDIIMKIGPIVIVKNCDYEKNAKIAEELYYLKNTILNPQKDEIHEYEGLQVFNKDYWDLITKGQKNRWEKALIKIANSSHGKITSTQQVLILIREARESLRKQ